MNSYAYRRLHTCSDYKRNYHFIPVGTKAVYAFANDPTQDCYIVYNFLTDDAKAFHTATLESADKSA